jgi:hypothetical protein
LLPCPIVVQQLYRVIADVRGQGTKVLLVKQNAHCAHAALALVGTDEIARRIRNLRLMRRSEAPAFPPEGRRVSGLA